MGKSIKRNAIFNIIKTCSAILFPLITFPYVSRVLKTENIGKVNFAASFVNYFALIATLGLGVYAIRECSSKRDNLSELVTTASQLYTINIITTLIAYACLFYALLTVKKIEVYRELIILESTTILFTTLGADWLNSVFEDFYYITVRTIAFQFISLLMVLLFVKTQNDYMKYAFISVLSSSGANIVNIFYRRRYCKISIIYNIGLRKHLKPIVLLFVMFLAQTIFNNADITMLGFMKNDHEVGLYSTAYKVTRIVSQIVQSLSLVIIPRLSLYFAKNDFYTANKLLRKVLLFNISLGFPIVIGVEMLANDIIMLIGGSGYEGAIPVIRVLILGFFFSLVGGSFLGNAILIPMGREDYYMYVCIVTAIANVILNAFLIPFLGAVGAAISTAFNGFIIFILFLLKIDKRICIDNIRSIFIAPLLGSVLIILSCIVCSMIGNRWIRIVSSILISSTVYFSILLLLKNDFAIDFMKKFARKVENT